MTAKLHTVHVRVNDAASGKPTPVRIRITDAAGTYYAPFGRLNQIPTDQGIALGGNVLIDGRQYAYIDGSTEINLPTEPISVEITKGPEYVPIRQEVQLGPGKIALRFALSRSTDLRTEGWYAGDICASFLTPQAALLEGAAEGLAVVNVLARVWPWQCEPDPDGNRTTYWTVPNILEFSGQEPAVQGHDALVVVNSYNWHHTLGALALLNCHRVVYPLTFGGRYGPDHWTLADWCDQCHRKGGLVVLFYSWEGPEGSARWLGEGLADFILGKTDAIHVTGGVDPGAYEAWYALLNCGLRATPVAGSSKASNLHVLGTPRTYAHLMPGHELNYKNWIEAIRSGRTFITNGPLITLCVHGAEPGATLALSAPDERVKARVEVRGNITTDKVELIYNGKVVGQCGGTESASTGVFEIEATIPESGWIAARCSGSGGCYAHSAPIYVRVSGERMKPKAEALALLFRQLDNTLQWIDQSARFEEERQQAHLTGLLQNAREALQRCSA